MNKKLCLALLACAGIALSGCGDSNPTPPAGKNTAAEKKSGSGSAEADWHEKARRYIKINNGIMRLVNPKYRENNSAESAKKGNFKEIRTDSYLIGDSFVRDLKEAIAHPGKFPAGVDESGKKLLSAAEKLFPTWTQLEAYNKAKKYEDDKGEKGKELLATYQKDIDALYQAVDEFDKQVDILAKEAHEKSLVEYKKKGLLLEMHTSLAMGAAEKIIDTFDSTDDFKNQAKIDEANAQLAIMETNVEAMKTEYAKRKEKNPKSLPMMDRYSSLQERLVAFAGYYREARKQPSRFNKAVDEYNRAVSERNRM
ncbi:MAG: YiiG family protein [Candidatus Accumulibacter sp.]|jgi:hypothetical protein|nr:YiiG family protein [Accumulibacter sp.]